MAIGYVIKAFLLVSRPKFLSYSYSFSFSNSYIIFKVNHKYSRREQCHVNHKGFSKFPAILFLKSTHILHENLLVLLRTIFIDKSALQLWQQASPNWRTYEFWCIGRCTRGQRPTGQGLEQVSESPFHNLGHQPDGAAPAGRSALPQVVQDPFAGALSKNWPGNSFITWWGFRLQTITGWLRLSYILASHSLLYYPKQLTIFHHTISLLGYQWYCHFLTWRYEDEDTRARRTAVIWSCTPASERARAPARSPMGARNLSSSLSYCS